MKTLYIGTQSYKKNTGSNWKIYFYLILIVAFVCLALKYTGSIMVEHWINRKGADKNGYAFSVREVGISLGRGQLNLKDVKVFNHKTSTEILESPDVTIQLNISDLILSQEKKITVTADKVDVIISKDLPSEIERVKKNELDLDLIEGKFGKLTIIQKKEDQTRTVLELNEAAIKIKDNEFNIFSKIADGGNLNLTGKEKLDNGSAFWSISGTMKQVSSDIFNKIAGDKLPFAFTESTLNADIMAESDNGKIEGEISPEIKKLNLLDEKPGVPTQSIKRILTEELTFTLPFTLKDELVLQYSDTFRKLKTYRKIGPAPGSSEARVSQAPASKAKKSFSFWPF